MIHNLNYNAFQTTIELNKNPINGNSNSKVSSRSDDTTPNIPLVV